MERLPLELVGKIVFQFLGQGDRRVLAQVCKAWRDTVWNSLQVSLPAQRQISLLKWFKKRASSVRHLSIGVKSYVDPKTKIEEDDALMHTSKDTSQFLSEVVDSASNLQTLSFSLNRYYDSDLDCATVAPFFPQLAHLRALELREPLRSSGDLSTGWFHLYSHLTGLTKLSYERSLCNTRGLQELTMIGMAFLPDGIAEMPCEIGSLHQLRKLKLEYCNYLGLAPNFSSLSNLETLTLKDRINDLTSLQDLDKLTHLTIHLREENIATLALVCPRNLQQLEIKSIGHLSFFRRDSLAIDMVFLGFLSKNPPLEEVKLIRMGLKGIPGPIACLPGLKRVDLSFNRLAGELREGLWLDSLEELCLIHNDLHSCRRPCCDARASCRS